MFECYMYFQAHYFSIMTPKTDLYVSQGLNRTEYQPLLCCGCPLTDPNPIQFGDPQGSLLRLVFLIHLLLLGLIL